MEKHTVKYEKTVVALAVNRYLPLGMVIAISLTAIASSVLTGEAAASKPLVDSIKPMIGAGSSGGIQGKTFPGAATPFGLVQLSPDTITGDNGSGYSYTHKSYTYAGQPWLTQKWARFTVDHAYGPGIRGLCGDEDVGQMSAWYLLSAIGIHPVSPVDGVYVIGSPLFSKVSVRLDPKYGGRGTFTVIARNNSPRNPYIQSAKLNGKPLERAWLNYREIVAGATLEIVMGPEPNKTWGAGAGAAPPSLSDKRN